MHTDERPDAKPWQERQRQLREDAVLDAAAALMAERGYAATSMDDVATRVGISKPTLYGHFPSKEVMAVAVALRRMGRAECALAAAAARAEAEGGARVHFERVLRAQLAEHGGPWLTRADVPRALLDAQPAVCAARERVWARLGALVTRCQAEGTCRTDLPAALLVRQLVRLFRDEYADLLAGGGAAGTALDADQLAAALVSLAFDGLAPRAAPAERLAGPPARSAARLTRRASAILAGVALAHATAAGAQGVARIEEPQPLIPQAVPRQTTPIPGVPDRAGGRAPGLPQTPAALAGRPLTLVDVLDAALRANPTAGAAGANAQAARAQFLAARANVFPSLTLTPGVTQSGNRGQFGGGGVIGGGGTTPIGTPTGILNQRTAFSPSVGLSFLLFDFGGRAGTIGSARETANAASATFDAAVVTTLLQAQQAYFTFQGSREVLAAQDSNVAAAEQSRDAAVARFRAGLATVADTLQTATQLAQARVTELNARIDLATARQALATVINARADASFDVAVEPGPTAAAAALATAALTARVDTLVARAVRQRPDVDATRDQALAATQDVRAARAALLPAVTVTATGGYNYVRALPVLTGTTYNVQLGLSLPLFDAGARRASVQAANALADAARQQADATTTQAANEVVNSSEVLRQAAARLAANDALLASAARNEEVARGRYTEGVGTVIDLINAQTALFTARGQNAQARWAWATAVAQLARDANLLGRRGELPAVAAPALPASTPTTTDSR